VSFLDSVLADTVGVGWRAVTGTVDPWTKQQIIDDTNASTTASLKSAQSNGYDITDAQIAATATENGTLITDTLKTTNFPGVPGGADSSDPSDAGIHVPGLGNVGSTAFLGKIDTIVNLALVGGVLLFGFWVYQNFGRAVGGSFSRK